MARSERIARSVLIAGAAGIFAAHATGPMVLRVRRSSCGVGMSNRSDSAVTEVVSGAAATFTGRLAARQLSFSRVSATAPRSSAHASSV